MLVDAHTHLTEPIDILLRKLGDAGIDKAVVCSSGLARGEIIQSLPDAKATMDRIARAQKTPDPEIAVQDINLGLADVVAKHQESLIGFGKIDLFGDNLLGAAQEVFELGLSGIGEVIGIHQNTGLLEPLVEFSHEHQGYPLFIHCDYPVDAADLQEIFKLSKRFNNSKIIIGHLGGDFWIEAVEAALSSPNIYLDTSEVVNGVALKVAVKELPERVVFASDFPWDSPEAMLRRFDFLNMDAGVKRRVLGLNMLEALGI